MNESLDFIIDRIKSGQCNGMENDDYTSLSEHDLNGMLSIMNIVCDNKKIEIKDISEIVNVVGDGLELNFKYNPCADFQYFTTETCINDGCITDGLVLIQDVLCKLTNGRTIYKPLFTEIQKYDNKKIKILYEVGNFVMGLEHDKKFGTKEKPWLTTRTTIMLPIKCSIQKK